MKLRHVLLFLAVTGNSIIATAQDQTKVNNLKCENLINPIGIDILRPNLSWQIHSEARNLTQSAYRILVSDDINALSRNEGNVWDSKKIKSGNSIMVPYGGKFLQSTKKYFWKVMVWDGSGKSSAWSEISSWQMGLLNPEDWGNAKWIGMEDFPESMAVVPGIHGNGDNLNHKGIQRPTIPLLRKEFEAIWEIASATLYISGLGQYECYINGKKIGNSFLSPGWTNYDKTVLYNSYNVTGNIKPGLNVIGAILGNGFYNINRERYRKLVISYGMPKLLCRLKIEYTNGEIEFIESGNIWKAAPSPINYTSIYGGEEYDARLEQLNWDTPGFDESCWKNAILVSAPNGKLTSEMTHPVTIKESLEVQNVQQLSQGKYLYDFGQNASGIVELKVKGKKGQVVRLVPGELITENGEANQRATGRWYYYTYILKGDGVETWRPRFTYYGFRYVQVEGAAPDTARSKDDFAQIVDLKLLHNCNSTPRIGSFQCSNELFNRIEPLIDWAIRSNMQSVLTDCPHREKLGWLEQTFLMGNSINYNYDTYNLYRKIIQDMMDGQTEDGLVPSIAPEYVVFEGGFRDSPEWGSASIILPWLLYKWYGDTKTMQETWPMMIKYIEYLSKKANNHILSHGLGDWFDIGPQRPGFAQLTPIEVTATSIYYYDLKLLSQMAGLMNKKTEKEHFSNWAEEVRKAFNSKFFDPVRGVYSNGSQTAMSMPLCFGMIDEKYHDRILTNLVDSIRKNNKALTAGDIGFHYLVEALANNGYSQLLFEMNNRDDVPGYGFQLKKGATALTESWQAHENVSNNHLMLGHILEWFYSGIGGIRQDENSIAYKNIIIKPAIIGDLTNAKTTFESPYGAISTDWKKESASFSININIPGNTSAMVYLPAKEGQTISEKNIPINQLKEIKFVQSQAGYLIYKVGSGSYNFSVK
jgi:hypothetical protein